MDTGLLVLHALVGLLFVGHGAQKLFGAFGGYGIEGTAGFMESLGLRPGRLQALAAGTSELVGGVLLALGLFVPLAALLIVSVMVAASLTAHKGKGVWVDKGGWELPLVYGAVAFALAAVGAGEYSLDAALGLDVAGIEWALGAVALGVAGGAGAVAYGRSRGSVPAAQTQGA